MYPDSILVYFAVYWWARLRTDRLAVFEPLHAAGQVADDVVVDADVVRPHVAHLLLDQRQAEADGVARLLQVGDLRADGHLRPLARGGRLELRRRGLLQERVNDAAVDLV